MMHRCFEKQGGALLLFVGRRHAKGGTAKAWAFEDGTRTVIASTSGQDFAHVVASELEARGLAVVAGTPAAGQVRAVIPNTDDALAVVLGSGA